MELKEWAWIGLGSAWSTHRVRGTCLKFMLGHYDIEDNKDPASVIMTHWVHGHKALLLGRNVTIKRCPWHEVGAKPLKQQPAAGLCTMQRREMIGAEYTLCGTLRSQRHCLWAPFICTFTQRAQPWFSDPFILSSFHLLISSSTFCVLSVIIWPQTKAWILIPVYHPPWQSTQGVMLHWVPERAALFQKYSKPVSWGSHLIEPLSSAHSVHSLTH